MRSLLKVILILFVAASVHTSYADSETQADLIAKIGHEKSALMREALARKLEATIRSAPPNSVNENTVGKIVPLLNDDDDIVIGWLAKALGEIGRPATVAVPMLDKILLKQDAEARRLGFGPDYSSEGNVCLAIYQIVNSIRSQCRPYSDAIKSLTE